MKIDTVYADPVPRPVEEWKITLNDDEMAQIVAALGGIHPGSGRRPIVNRLKGFLSGDWDRLYRHGMDLFKGML